MSFERDYNKIHTYCAKLRTGILANADDIINEAYIKMVETRAEYKFESFIIICCKIAAGCGQKIGVHFQETGEYYSNEIAGEDKHCIGCNITLPIGHFFKGRASSNGIYSYSSRCKQCTTDYNRNRYKIKRPPSASRILQSVTDRLKLNRKIYKKKRRTLLGRSCRKPNTSIPSESSKSYKAYRGYIAIKI